MSLEFDFENADKKAFFNILKKRTASHLEHFKKCPGMTVNATMRMGGISEKWNNTIGFHNQTIEGKQEQQSALIQPVVTRSLEEPKKMSEIEKRKAYLASLKK